MTNADHVLELSKRSRDQLAVEIGKSIEHGLELAQKAAELEVSAINALRAAGIQLQEASGHQQINFTFFDKFKRDYPEALKNLTFQGAKLCVKVARKLKVEVTSLNEIRRFKQAAFECLDLAEPARRDEAQHAVEVNFRSEVVRLVPIMMKAIKAIEQDEGNEASGWIAHVLEPLAMKHAEAMEML